MGDERWEMRGFIFGRVFCCVGDVGRESLLLARDVWECVEVFFVGMALSLGEFFCCVWVDVGREVCYWQGMCWSV